MAYQNNEDEGIHVYGHARDGTCGTPLLQADHRATYQHPNCQLSRSVRRGNRLRRHCRLSSRARAFDVSSCHATSDSSSEELSEADVAEESSSSAGVIMIRGIEKEEIEEDDEPSVDVDTEELVVNTTFKSVVYSLIASGRDTHEV